MYRKQQRLLRERLRSVLQAKYQVELPQIAIEQPPDLEMGEYALPVAFELARRFKRSPRAIAGELVADLLPLEGFTSFKWPARVISTASLIARRPCSEIARDDTRGRAEPSPFAGRAHQHQSQQGCAYRSSAQRDPRRYFVRLLRAAGQRVDVQNYIDNTGVQVADVVVGLTHLEGYDLAGVTQLLVDLKARGERIDYYCWDLYARVSQWYDAFGSGGEGAQSKFVSKRCMPSRLGAMRLRGLPTWFRPRCCAGIWRPCCGWASNMIFCLAKARSSISSFGISPSNS